MILYADDSLYRKVTDDSIDEQLTENASLRMILQWYERHIYRHLYLPLFQTENDATIKCVCVLYFNEEATFSII